MNDRYAPPDAFAAGCEHNRALLEQCRHLVRDLDAAQMRRASRTDPENTIGRQLRHLLDHQACLLGACATRVVDYTDRNRGLRCERDPDAALERIDALDAALARLPEDVQNRTLEVVLDDGARSPTTFARELDFVASHATHHLALIASLAAQLDVRVPSDLGVSRATQRHRARARGRLDTTPPTDP